MIHVVAIVTAHPGQRDALLDAAQANMAAVRAEEGCIEYVAVTDAARTPAKFGPDVLVFIEKWASPEALAAHSASPHMAAYAAATKHLVASRAIHVLEPV